MAHDGQNRLGRHAVVIGGSIAGLLAAEVLARHFERVTVLDRDTCPNGPLPRSGTPQARHIHLLLASGQNAFDQVLPGVVREILDEGAIGFDSANDVAWLTPFGWALRILSGVRNIGGTRDLIEWVVRRRACANERINLRTAVTVSALSADTSGRLNGVIISDITSGGVDPQIEAELVVDASGRNSAAPRWLGELGYPPPGETVVNGFLGYASRFVRPPSTNRDWKALYIQPAPPSDRRGGVISPVEEGRWIVTLIGGGKDYPPTDEDGFRDFAASLRDPVFASALNSATEMSSIVGNRTTENRVRHYEHLARQPERFLVIGDAACAFNPVYGQGMSVAAIGALILDDCLRDCASPEGLSDLGRVFQRRLAKAHIRPWLLATAQDYRYQEVQGEPPRLAMWLKHRYMDLLMRRACSNSIVRQKLQRTVHMLGSPSELLQPSVLLRVIFGMP
jgi:2-polyprenyl-6-methoxyphenol hydroxylase-like FAD-dependent oxidoreductase